MTLTRVFISAFYLVDNPTKQNGIVAFITAMEPIVGITNACMPFFPAVVRHITQSQQYKGISQLFKSQPSQMSKNSENSMSWGGSSGGGSSNAKIRVQGRKDGPGLGSWDDDTTELTGIKVRNDISIVESGLAGSARSSF